MRSERVTPSMRVTSGERLVATAIFLMIRPTLRVVRRPLALIDQQSVRFLLVDGKLWPRAKKRGEKVSDLTEVFSEESRDIGSSLSFFATTMTKGF